MRTLQVWVKSHKLATFGINFMIVAILGGFVNLGASMAYLVVSIIAYEVIVRLRFNGMES